MRDDHRLNGDVASASLNEQGFGLYEPAGGSRRISPGKISPIQLRPDPVAGAAVRYGTDANVRLAVNGASIARVRKKAFAPAI